MDALILVANPGSASRKYALYQGGALRGSLHFEFENGQVVCTVNKNSRRRRIKTGVKNFNLAIKYLISLLYKSRLLNPSEDIDAIGIRVVAAGKFFTGDHLVNEVFIKELEKARETAPLHIQTIMDEVRELFKVFKTTEIVAVSDSAFHANRPERTMNYAISAKLAKRFDIKRWGYHGISMSSVVSTLRSDKRYHKLDKVVVAHLGSGCSITGLKNWQSFDTSMGYSPLEGLMSSTRSGSIDVVAALKIKKAFKMNDAQLEVLLNKGSGLLAVSEKSDDIRTLQKLAKTGNEKAELALEMFVYRAVSEIGRMITAVGGVYALVFTGTVGERSFIIRDQIIDGLRFLGFRLAEKVNLSTVDPENVVEVSTRKSPLILVVPTNENAEIARRTLEFIDD
ncbi:MAG: hypothetical protein LBK50_02940 [Candidatus Nomurabacteria bacterium]|jgi:acetate kinase|nr:hypothetical protein [Candidatus Nomurabacteria bacterium]